LSQEASGKFDIQLSQEGEADAIIGRLGINKRYHGGLEASAAGEMLAARTATDGSAGYVAMERVSGSLDHKVGSFVLQHTGTMNRGAQTISVTIVPDSGTGDLTGISGEMFIEAANGSHRYRLVYTLPKPK
jgi:hypothetical protein